MKIQHNGYLLLPRLSVQNLNTISSPATWGAPAPTALFGLMAALQRNMPSNCELSLLKVGMVIHSFEAQTNGDYIKGFNLARAPLEKDGSTASITEEGRAHAMISLIFGVRYDGAHDEQTLKSMSDEAFRQVKKLRFAGGSIIHNYDDWHQPTLIMMGDEDESESQPLAQLKRSLLPGYALLSREDVLLSHTASLQEGDPTMTALDALLDLSRRNRVCVTECDDETGEVIKVTWEDFRAKNSGWLVPIPVGYSALSELYEAGEVKNSRDPSVPFRFVEALYSLGEWRSPHRLNTLSALLWHTETNHEAGLYRCVNHH